MKLFRIETGETDWVFAVDDDAAWHFMCTELGAESHRDGVAIVEVPRDRWAHLMINDDGVQRSALEIFEKEQRGDTPFQLGSTCV